MLFRQLSPLRCSEVRVIQEFVVLGRFDACFLLLFLVNVPTISKISNGVDVERVFSLANNRLSELLDRALLLVIRLLAENVQCVPELLFFIAACQGVPALFALQRAENHVVFLVRARIVYPAPVPRHAALAVAFWEVVIAVCAGLVRSDPMRLQSVCQDDIRIHRGHVKVVNHRFYQSRMVGLLAQCLKLLEKAIFHLLVICDIIFYEKPSLVPGIEIGGVVLFDCRDSVNFVYVVCVHVVLEVLVQRVNYLVVPCHRFLRIREEVVLKVYAVYAGVDCLHSAACVRLRNENPLLRRFRRFLSDILLLSQVLEVHFPPKILNVNAICSRVHCLYRLLQLLVHGIVHVYLRHL